MLDSEKAIPITMHGTGETIAEAYARLMDYLEAENCAHLVGDIQVDPIMYALPQQRRHAWVLK